jgi:hypothetical protein
MLVLALGLVQWRDLMVWSRSWFRTTGKGRERNPDDCELVIKYLPHKKRGEVLSYSTPEQATHLRERQDFWTDPAATWAKLTPRRSKEAA